MGNVIRGGCANISNIEDTVQTELADAYIDRQTRTYKKQLPVQEQGWHNGSGSEASPVEQLCMSENASHKCKRKAAHSIIAR